MPPLLALVDDSCGLYHEICELIQEFGNMSVRNFPEKPTKLARYVAENDSEQSRNFDQSGYGPTSSRMKRQNASRFVLALLSRTLNKPTNRLRRTGGPRRLPRRLHFQAHPSTSLQLSGPLAPVSQMSAKIRHIGTTPDRTVFVSSVSSPFPSVNREKCRKWQNGVQGWPRAHRSEPV